MSMIPRRVTRSVQAARYASSSSLATSLEPLAFPHPELAEATPETTTYLTIRAFERIPSSAHALALVRAAEARVGPIINVEVPKDSGNLLPGPFIHITLLNPYTLPKESTLHEIPSPSISHNLSYPGGPSLSDLSNPTSSPSTEPLKYRLEKRQRPPKTWRTYPQVRSRDVERTDEQEDRRIVESLKGFEGFAGALKGLGRDFEPFLRMSKGRIEAAVPAAAEGAASLSIASEPVSPEPASSTAETVVEKVQEAAETVISATQSFAEAVTPSSTETHAETIETEPTPPKLSRKERLMEQARQAAKSNALLAAERSTGREAEVEAAVPSSAAASTRDAPRKAEKAESEKSSVWGKWIKSS